MANTKKKTTPVATKKDNTVEIPVVAAMTKAEPKKEAKVEAKKEADNYKRFKSEFERYLSEEEKNEISDKIYERQEAEIEGGLWQDFDLDR